MSPFIIWCARMKLPQIYISVQKLNCCSKVKNGCTGVHSPDTEAPASRGAEEVSPGSAVEFCDEAREDVEQEAEDVRRP